MAPDLSARGIGSRGQPTLQEDEDPDPSFRWVVERAYPWSRTYTATQWTDLLQTQSDHRLLPDGQRARLLEAIADVIERHGGHYEHPYVAWLRAAARQGS